MTNFAMKSAILSIFFTTAALGKPDSWRENARFPFKMPKGHKPMGGNNFVATCYNFINAVSKETVYTHDAQKLCQADSSLCQKWSDALPEVIKAKKTGEAKHNQKKSYKAWCHAVREEKDPQDIVVTMTHHNKHAHHTVDNTAAHLAEQSDDAQDALHVRLAKQAERLREAAAAAKAKAAQAAQEAEDKKAVANMMKELSAKAAKEIAEKESNVHSTKAKTNGGHKKSLISSQPTTAAKAEDKDPKYEELVKMMEHKMEEKHVEAAPTTPKPQAKVTHHGWDDIIATESKMDGELKSEAPHHRRARGAEYVQESATSKVSERTGIVGEVEELYDEAASFIHRHL